jgi:hypothetical protein
MSTSVQPWEQQSEEPDLHFLWFGAYLLQGATRSLEGAYRAWLTDNGVPSGVTGCKKRAPGAWQRAAKQWRWEERARAYDLHTLVDRVRESVCMALEIDRVWHRSLIRAIEAGIGPRTYEELLSGIQEVHASVPAEVRYAALLQSRPVPGDTAAGPPGKPAGPPDYSHPKPPEPDQPTVIRQPESRDSASS